MEGVTFYPTGVRVPDRHVTDRLVLRPLRATDVELDYDAVMSSAADLRRWSQSDWPADGFTLAENLVDLEEHEREHEAREAFTFTVLDPTETRCLGCVYLMSPRDSMRTLTVGSPGTDEFPVRVGFWVRSSEIANDLDRHLLVTLREWLRDEWAFTRVLFGIAPADERQQEILRKEGLPFRGETELPRGRTIRVYS